MKRNSLINTGRIEPVNVEARLRQIRFEQMLWRGTPDPLEWLFSALKTCWGFWLLLPMHMFDTAPHLYRFVALVPESIWGAAWMLTGIAQGLSWYFDYKPGRYAFSLIGTGLWLLYGFLMWLADHRTGTLVFVGVLAAFQALAAMWLSPRNPHTPSLIEGVPAAREAEDTCA
jgi:hypothetical protein